MDKKTFFISALLVLVIISLAVNFVLISLIAKEQKIMKSNQVNEKVLNFRNMFTEDVLLSSKEIDFDTRLALETSVRSLNDPEILTQWQAFVNSTTKDDATTQAKKLLELLIQKTQN
jgi:hypothetical protein